MEEWWTYRLSDILPFSPQTHYRLFELHNEAIWPAQLLTLGGSVVIFVLMLGHGAWRGRVVSLLLAAAWAFVAWSYFLTHYAPLNWAATYFAWGFAAEALLLVVSGAVFGRLTFSAEPKSPAAKAAFAIFLFALLVQPLIGPAFGRPWSGVELFGIAPDPSALATLGVLLVADRVRTELVVIPLVWCGVTGAILFGLSAPEASLMPTAGLAVLCLALYKGLRQDPEPG